ncbi:hypothetical protein KKE45_00670 [Patescibacteria group bacterium]|nr:hypothetical protein [Patescibacteria group bacterium]
MAKRKKRKTRKEKEPFRLSLRHIIRIALFLFIIFGTISLINQTPKKDIIDPTVLKEENQQNNNNLATFLSNSFENLPDSTKEKILGVSNTSVVKNIQSFFDTIKKEIPNFPQKQINDLKKSIISNIYKDIMKGLENNNN